MSKHAGTRNMHVIWMLLLQILNLPRKKLNSKDIFCIISQRTLHPALEGSASQLFSCLWPLAEWLLDSGIALTHTIVWTKNRPYPPVSFPNLFLPEMLPLLTSLALVTSAKGLASPLGDLD